MQNENKTPKYPNNEKDEEKQGINTDEVSGLELRLSSNKHM